MKLDCFKNVKFYGKRTSAHATKEEAIKETEQMINVYSDFTADMAMPVIKM